MKSNQFTSLQPTILSLASIMLRTKRSSFPSGIVGRIYFQISNIWLSKQLLQWAAVQHTRKKKILIFVNYLNDQIFRFVFVCLFVFFYNHICSCNTRTTEEFFVSKCKGDLYIWSELWGLFTVSPLVKHKYHSFNGPLKMWLFVCLFVFSWKEQRKESPIPHYICNGAATTSWNISLYLHSLLNWERLFF